MRSRDTAFNRAARMIDNQIGARIQSRRKHMGLTQSQLAVKLDLSYQQFQKYESGTNRVSAGRLWQIAKILYVEPSYFFEGVEDSADYGQLKDDNSDAMEVLKDFDMIQYSDVRSAVSGLLKTLACGRKGRYF